MFARTPEISLLQFESETNVEVGIVLFLSVEAPPQMQTELSPQFTDSVALIFGMRDGKSPGLGGHTLNWSGLAARVGATVVGGIVVVFAVPFDAGALVVVGGANFKEKNQ